MKSESATLRNQARTKAMVITVDKGAGVTLSVNNTKIYSVTATEWWTTLIAFQRSVKQVEKINLASLTSVAGVQKIEMNLWACIFNGREWWGVGKALMQIQESPLIRSELLKHGPKYAEQHV